MKCIGRVLVGVALSSRRRAFACPAGVTVDPCLNKAGRLLRLISRLDADQANDLALSELLPKVWVHALRAEPQSMGWLPLATQTPNFLRRPQPDRTGRNDTMNETRRSVRRIQDIFADEHDFGGQSMR